MRADTGGMRNHAIERSPGQWTAPDSSLPAWNWLPPGHGVSPRLDRVPDWVRVWYRIPFVDRYAYAWMWRHGGWDVFGPEPTDPATGAEVRQPRDPAPTAPASQWRHADRDELVEVVSEALGHRVAVDDWRPGVQGAVGHVVGLTGDDGTRFVVKVFPPEASQRAATEIAALRLVAGAGVQAPALVAHAELPGGQPFVVTERMPGARWADRRDDLNPHEAVQLHTEVAALLGRLHAIEGPAFGSLTDAGTRFASAWHIVDWHTEAATTGYVAAGGSANRAEAVRRLVASQRPAFDERLNPSLCHHDLNGGNVLVTASGPPHITGLTDFERAAWDDPMRDLALTVLHLWHHDPSDVSQLVTAYGPLMPADTARLTVHQALLAMAERTWVVSDQPAGWQTSAARLDTLLDDLLDGLLDDTPSGTPPRWFRRSPARE